jgi:NRAMP (natural resistance-associated macrophage protein)-like metal ion transporter
MSAEDTDTVPSTTASVPTEPNTYRDKLKKPLEFWQNLGPGLTTGASDDDPSGITTYSQAGAQYGFRLLWMVPFTLPFMAIVQEMCARIGLVTGRGLAANIRKHFPRPVLYMCALLLFIANSFNLGANLGAMAKASQLLMPSLNFGLMVFAFAFISLFFQVFSSYQQYAKYLKWLALVLLAYIFSALSVPGLDWGEVIRQTFTIDVTFNKELIIMICALLGTTISPYLFFWQTSQEVEEEILAGKTSIAQRVRETSPKDIKKMRTDVWSGMFLSNLVMFFIMVACGATLFASGITNITSTADAANALRPFAGDTAYIVFALAIIGTGLLSVPVLAGSSSYAISESFGWREGLYRKLNKAKAFYGVIAASTIVGLLTNFIGIDPIKALIYAAVLNGIIAPIVLFLIVILASNKKIMGEWVNTPVRAILGWFIAIIMSIAGLGAIWALI